MIGTMMMNSYGREAQEYWQKHRPRAYQAIEDPETFFTNVGEEIAAQVEQATLRLQGTDPEGEGYLEKVARLNSARITAEELVKREILFLPPEPSTDETELRLEWRGSSPSEMVLLDWAELQEPHGALTDEMDVMAARWMLPVEFFLELANAENPQTVLDSSRWATARLEAAEARFTRWVANGADPNDSNA